MLVLMFGSNKDDIVLSWLSKNLMGTKSRANTHSQLNVCIHNISTEGSMLQ